MIQLNFNHYFLDKHLGCNSQPSFEFVFKVTFCYLLKEEPE
jgi:hypothetical protein